MDEKTLKILKYLFIALNLNKPIGKEKQLESMFALCKFLSFLKGKKAFNGFMHGNVNKHNLHTISLMSHRKFMYLPYVIYFSAPSTIDIGEHSSWYFWTNLSNQWQIFIDKSIKSFTKRQTSLSVLLTNILHRMDFNTL